MYKELIAKLMRKESELKDRVLTLEMANAEMRDRLVELGEDAKYNDQTRIDRNSYLLKSERLEDVATKLKEENDFLQKDTLTQFNHVKELLQNIEEFRTIVYETPNNMELGKKIRGIVNDGKDN